MCTDKYLNCINFSNSEEFCSSSTMVGAQAGWPWINSQGWCPCLQRLGLGLGQTPSCVDTSVVMVLSLQPKIKTKH